MKQDSRSSRVWHNLCNAAKGSLHEPETAQHCDSVIPGNSPNTYIAPRPTLLPIGLDNATPPTNIPRRYRRSSSRRLKRPSTLRTDPSFDGQTTYSSTLTSSWTEDTTTLAPPTPSFTAPPPVWTLRLPEAIIATPSLLKLTHDELRSRGVYSPQTTMDTSKVCTPTALTRPSFCRTVRSLSIKSALSSSGPYPGVRPLMCTDKDRGSADSSSNPSPEKYAKPIPSAMIVLGICLSVFIISLDRGIVATAVPSIVEEFHAYSDIGWYGSAYMMTASAFQPLYGRIYTYFDVKWSYLVAVTIFEIGSLLCGIAPNSMILIIGRAVQGLGGAGMLTGSLVVATHSVRPSKRPVIFAFVGVLYGIGVLCGPILGGIFSQLLSWRWCFYLNLPSGGLVFLGVFLFFKPAREQTTNRQKPDLSVLGSTFFRRMKALDWIGNMLFTAACVLLFLALQWSQETSFGWSSARCIATISLSVVLFIVFAFWLWCKGHEALIPLHILRQRTVAVSCGSAFFIYGALLIHSYYLPMWFQAVKKKTAMDSGIEMIPYTLTNAFFNLTAGIFVSRYGLFAPPAIVGCAIATVGAGLVATLQPNSSTTTWAGFQVLVSAGLGMATQQGFSAVQASLPIDEVPIGTAAVVACQSAGGAIFVSVGNVLLQNHLFNANIAETIPNINVRAVVGLGASRFRNLVPAENLPAVINLYNDALQAVFIAAVPLCGLAFICTLGMEWKTLRCDEQCSSSFDSPSHDVEGGNSGGFDSPELGSDAPTLAHLAPQARARWNQKWKRPRCQLRSQVPTLSIVPELNISEKTLAPFHVQTERFLAGEIKEMEVESEIGKAIST